MRKPRKVYTPSLPELPPNAFDDAPSDAPTQGHTPHTPHPATATPELTTYGLPVQDAIPADWSQLPPRPPVEYPEFEGEPRRSASCFRLYCNLGPNRSLRQLETIWRESGGKIGVNFFQLKNWSSKYAWVRRSGEFDARQDAIDAWYEREQRRLLNLEQEKLNKLVERRMLERLAALLDADERYEQELARQGKYRGPGSRPLVGAVAAVQWYTRAGDVRRLALGADTPMTQQQQQLAQQLAQQQQDLRIVIELDGEPARDIVDAIPVYQAPIEPDNTSPNGSYNLALVAPGIEVDDEDTSDSQDSVTDAVES